MIIKEDIEGFYKIIEYSFGFVVTGLFLSLGSKFWHDLLDVLFRVKNVQQRLNESETYTSVSSVDQVTTLMNISNYEVAQKLYDKYNNEIWQIQGVVTMGLKSILDKNLGLLKE